MIRISENQPIWLLQLRESCLKLRRSSTGRSARLLRIVISSITCRRVLLSLSSHIYPADSHHFDISQIAIVVLFSTIWYDQEPEQQPSADYRLISDATSAFHRALSSIRERVRNVARQSLLVVQCLFEALHNRQPNNHGETYAQVLKRISLMVTDAERRAVASANGAPYPNGQATQPPNSAPYPPNQQQAPGQNPQQLQSQPGGPVDSRGVIMASHGQLQGHPQQQQQQAYYAQRPPGSVLFPLTLLRIRRANLRSFNSSASNSSSIPPHDLHFDIGADWGFEWMQLPQL